MNNKSLKAIATLIDLFCLAYYIIIHLFVCGANFVYYINP